MNKRKIPHYNQGNHSVICRENLNAIIFGAETRAGKLFDILLIISISISVLSVMLGSVQELNVKYELLFNYLEWFFTALFTLEYLARLIAVRKAWLYARSFFGLIDLLSILPSYIALLMPGVEYLLIIRILRLLRLLRIFRIFKLVEYVDEAETLIEALQSSYHKILVFLYAVLTLAIVFGSLLYVIEGSVAGFTSIPKSIYWAIVTLTTVGYGDIAPQTPLGQIIAASIMIMGYGIIAVPTGIYSSELIKSHQAKSISNHACHSCGKLGHDSDANYAEKISKPLSANHHIVLLDHL
jgi:voltage-gated potassium channel